MSRTTFYSKNYVGWPPTPIRDYSDPNSLYWMRQTKDAQRRLTELLGAEDYRLWAEMTWPDDVIDTKSWQELWKDVNDAISLGEDALYQQLECSCKPDAGIACPVCRAYCRIREREEQIK